MKMTLNKIIDIEFPSNTKAILLISIMLVEAVAPQRNTKPKVKIAVAIAPFNKYFIDEVAAICVRGNDTRMY